MGCCIGARPSQAEDMSPLAASSFGSPLAALMEEVQMDQPTPSMESREGPATNEIEADIDPREIEMVEAHQDGIQAGAVGESPAGEASLTEYFLKHYKGGGVFQHEAYEHDHVEWCWIHKSSGIKVWGDALDLTQSGGSGEVQCYFHYTTQVGFRNITAPSKKAVEVFASLVTSGPKANAWWGAGVYSVRKAPHHWPDVATLIDNNYRNMHARDVQEKGRKAADEEYASRVAYCIPILATAATCYDVSVQQTPEMEKEGKPPGVNLADKLLNEPGQPERECVVIRVEREEIVGHASAVLLDTLRCRADATARRLGPEHIFALQALSRLADVLVARGAFTEAEPLRRRVLDGYERLWGPEHRQTLTAVHNLASVLERLGQFHEAEALYRRALAGKEVLAGANHLETLTSKHNLAVLLLQQGKLAEAAELQRKALAGRQAQLGVQHPHTLSSVSVLAAILQLQGKLEEAEDLHRRALEGGKSQLGAQHPDILVLVNNLAALLQKQGKLEEAEDLHRRALEGRESQLGPQHPDTLISANNLAMLLEQQGKLEEAEELYCRALAGREDQLGPMHPDTLGSVRNLAILLELKGSFAEAEGLYRRDLAGREDQLGAMHPDTLISVWNLGKLLEAKGSFAEAEELYRRALAGFEDQLGPMHPHTLVSVWSLAKLLEAKGSFAEAGQLYLRELRGMEELHGPEHEGTQRSRSNWERFQRKHGPIS